MILLPTPKQLEVFEERFVLRYDAYRRFCFRKR